MTGQSDSEPIKTATQDMTFILLTMEDKYTRLNPAEQTPRASIQLNIDWYLGGHDSGLVLFHYDPYRRDLKS